MYGLAAHKIVIQKLNIYNNILIVLFLSAHSSDQTQPLDIGVFAVAKRFMLNYHSNFICIDSKFEITPENYAQFMVIMNQTTNINIPIAYFNYRIKVKKLTI